MYKQQFTATGRRRIVDHQWDRHFKGGVISALNLFRTYIWMRLVFIVFGIQVSFIWWKEILFNMMIDTMSSNNLFEGWELLQFISFMQREIKFFPIWESFKHWIKEKGFDTFGDFVSDHLGRLTGFLIMAAVAGVFYIVWKTIN